MKKVSVRHLFWAAGRPEGSVEEAIEALRRLWRRDEEVKRLMEVAAKEGYILVDRDCPPAFTAAVQVALNRLRERIAPSPSPTVVRLGEGKKERKQPKSKSWSWTSPEGVRYTVYPHDLPMAKDSPYWALRDRRVQEAKEWVENFLSTGQEVLGPSAWEEALEYEDNPHFMRSLLPADLEEKLLFLGWKGELRELPAFVDRIPTKERELAEAIRQVDTLVDQGQVAARRVHDGWEVRKARITQALLALDKAVKLVEEGEWTTRALISLVAQFAPFTPSGAKITRLVEEIAVLRHLAKVLEDLMQAPVKAVAYHGPTEVVLTVNAYKA
ncbi:hypothetical protein [Thermus caldifontis]|uniref:hypothetical protein n=1 Tax=Thermus caldifontis TaxID=1930763 RepID=UPI000DF1B7A0|nr:hypothetical protein [Thermus caldifontis]